MDPIMHGARMNPGALIVVSNRLPVTLKSGHELQPDASNGGLVSALTPILDRRCGHWVGCPGTAYDPDVERVLKRWSSSRNYAFQPVFLTDDERAGYYQGFSNEIIWPLFHGLPSRCQFDNSYWNAYCQVNEKFADAVQAIAQDDDFVWVHDYHLMKIAGCVHQRNWRRRMAYFHHIPFPCPDIFETLPWRSEVIQSLMHFEVLGFQTRRDQNNFIACLERFAPYVRISQAGEQMHVRANGRRFLVGTYPIGIDYDAFACASIDSSLLYSLESLKAAPGFRVVVGVDRLDYTKGIPQRLSAFEKLLECNASLRGLVSMLQIVVPSREEIPEYKQLRLSIETLVSRINGKYSRPGWIPIHYFHQAVSQRELIAFYRTAHIAAVTPLRDGMNLVAKEFCASKIDSTGVLILSEFAGAAQELKCGALLVNPNDCHALVQAFETALSMEESEQRRRMLAMQRHLRKHDVFQWAESFIGNRRVDSAISESFVGWAQKGAVSNF